MGLFERAVQGVLREIEDRFSVILSQKQHWDLLHLQRPGDMEERW
jgi:hypothetical protein